MSRIVLAGVMPGERRLGLPAIDGLDPGADGLGEVCREVQAEAEERRDEPLMTCWCPSEPDLR